MENIYMPKDNQYLNQILDVTTSDATYPYCKNCFKKVNLIYKKYVSLNIHANKIFTLTSVIFVCFNILGGFVVAVMRNTIK